MRIIEESFIPTEPEDAMSILEALGLDPAEPYTQVTIECTQEGIHLRTEKLASKSQINAFNMVTKRL